MKQGWLILDEILMQVNNVYIVQIIHVVFNSALQCVISQSGYGKRSRSRDRNIFR